MLRQISGGLWRTIVAEAASRFAHEELDVAERVNWMRNHPEHWAAAVLARAAQRLYGSEPDADRDLLEALEGPQSRQAVLLRVEQQFAEPAPRALIEHLRSLSST
jgi:hypothetical protein